MQEPQHLFSKTVRERIDIRLETAAPTLAEVARDMAINARTLQRRLKEEGTSFSELFDDLRRDQALSALSTGRQPIGDLAQRLGFRQQSSFTRAVCRWTGQPPSEIKRRLM